MFTSPGGAASRLGGLAQGVSLFLFRQTLGSKWGERRPAANENQRSRHGQCRRGLRRAHFHAVPVAQVWWARLLTSAASSPCSGSSGQGSNASASCHHRLQALHLQEVQLPSAEGQNLLHQRSGAMAGGADLLQTELHRMLCWQIATGQREDRKFKRPFFLAKPHRQGA
jgi:hypothetical protein